MKQLHDSPFGGEAAPQDHHNPDAYPELSELVRRDDVGIPAEGYGRTPFLSNNFLDKDGNPAGGYVTGVGFDIVWQNGPTRDAETGRKLRQTGAFVEDVALAIIQRLEFYQEGRFASDYNAAALDHFRRGLVALESRRREREARGVDGTHQV